MCVCAELQIAVDVHGAQVCAFLSLSSSVCVCACVSVSLSLCLSVFLSFCLAGAVSLSRCLCLSSLSLPLSLYGSDECVVGAPGRGSPAAQPKHPQQPQRQCRDSHLTITCNHMQGFTQTRHVYTCARRWRCEKMSTSNTTHCLSDYLFVNQPALLVWFGRGHARPHSELVCDVVRGDHAVCL